jgi:hypothetical protein
MKRRVNGGGKYFRSLTQSCVSHAKYSRDPPDSDFKNQMTTLGPTVENYELLNRDDMKTRVDQ